MRKRDKRNKGQIPDLAKQKPVQTHLCNFTRDEERNIAKAIAMSKIFFMDYGKAHGYISPKQIKLQDDADQLPTS